MQKPEVVTLDDEDEDVHFLHYKYLYDLIHGKKTPQ